MQFGASLAKKKYSLNCLLVAEDSAFAFDTKVKVEILGLRVLTIARTFEEIEEALSMYSIDLVLSDTKFDETNFVYEVYSNQDNLPPLILFSESNLSEALESGRTSISYVSLHKPIDERTLKVAVADALRGRIDALKKSGDIRRVQDTLYVRSSGKLLSIGMNEIHYVKAEGNYCTLHIDSRRIVVRSSLSNVLKRIDKPCFIQIHRGYIVNVHSTNELSIGNRILQVGEEKLPIGRKYRSDLISVLKNPCSN